MDVCSTLLWSSCSIPSRRAAPHVASRRFAELLRAYRPLERQNCRSESPKRVPGICSVQINEQLPHPVATVQLQSMVQTNEPEKGGTKASIPSIPMFPNIFHPETLHPETLIAQTFQPETLLAHIVHPYTFHP